MKPLHVALIVKNTPAAFERDCRNMGIFSYATPEFTWEHLAPGKGATLNTRDLKADGFDLAFIEDGGSYPDFRGDALPTVFYSIDSTLSDDLHFAPRIEQARKADLVLVDHDRLERFAPCGRPVRRLSYAVNDRLFHPEAKTLDVCFHCSGSLERRPVRIALHEMTQARGLSYRSGAVSLSEYAANLNRAKVVVNVPRTAINRPHRVFDALAAGAALVTTPLPEVSEEDRKPGRHYLEAAFEQLVEKAVVLVENGTWELLAIGGHEWAQAHTWAVRSRELRAMLAKELGL